VSRRRATGADSTSTEGRAGAGVVRMRSPLLSADPPGPPKGRRLHAVRYTDTRGQTVTTLFWRLGSAERLRDRVMVRGGTAITYATEVGGWVGGWSS